MKTTDDNEVLDHDGETQMPTTDVLRWTLLGKGKWDTQQRGPATPAGWKGTKLSLVCNSHKGSDAAERPLKGVFPADTFAGLAPPISLISGLENPCD